MGTLLNKAVMMATALHDGQFRKKTDIPYILHPLEALTIVGTMTTDEEILAAAVLHDVVEDTDTSLDEIEEQFGARVAALVSAVSENKREDRPAAATWKIRKEETLGHLKTATHEVKMVALGDKLSNMRAICRDYEDIGDALWQRFNVQDKNAHGWYYEGIAACLADLHDTAAYREYTALLQRVFQTP